MGRKKIGQQLIAIARSGIFNLSKAAIIRLEELGVPREHQDFFSLGKYRDDSRLVQTILELKARASTRGSRLVVVAIPTGVQWEVHDLECSGGEYVTEVHRTWGSELEVSAVPTDWVQPKPTNFTAMVTVINEAKRRHVLEGKAIGVEG